MSGIVDLLAKSMGAGEIGAISSALGGADQGQTQSAIMAALPMLMSAMANNAKSEEGANALAGALDRDHDGSILDNLGGALGSAATATMGNSILKHVLGGKRPVMENGLSEVSGLNPAMSGQLISMLAPVVMGYLGKQKREQNLDANGMASMLGGAKEEAVQANPQMGMLNMLLDRDGDGSIVDDVAGMGMNILGNMFGGKK